MGETNFKGLVIGFILISLFMYAMLIFSGEIADDYGKDKNQITGGAVDIDNLTGFLDGIYSQSDEQEKAFKDRGLITVVASNVILGIWDVTLGVGTMITIPFSYISNVLLIIFEVPTVVIYVLIGILTLISLFAVWKLWKIGY